MARRGGLTNMLYGLARASATGRAARRGPGALAKRQVRRVVYKAEGKETRKLFKRSGCKPP
jgi:hypothetical protein